MLKPKLVKPGLMSTRKSKRAYDRDYYLSHKEDFRNNGIRSVLRRKMKVLAHYGEVCACCGESWPVFLTMDHIDGGGNAHRKASIGAKVIYRWLVKNNYPPGFQVLCANCNLAKHQKKVCPHQSTTGRNAHAPKSILAHDNRLAFGGSSLPEDASSGA